MLEKHYCENSWVLVKQNKISVWGSFEPVEISEEIDWNIDPFNNDTWSFYFNGLNWLYSYLWAVDNCEESPQRIFDIITQYNKHINGNNPNKMVWFDHATSDRLSIFTAISLHPCMNMASDDFRLMLEELILKHIDKIIEFKISKNWINSNHGIFHALALLNACLLNIVNTNRPNLERDALEYLSDTLLSILSIDEYLSLEQSAYYHQLAISLLQSLDENHLQGIGIEKDAFIEKMKHVNYWLTSTDKKLIAMGDTSVVSNVERRYITDYSPTKMAKTFKETGFSVVKYMSEKGWNNLSFLHHSERAPHGHFDALSITLSKANKEFIIDSGGPYRYGNQLRFRYFMSSFAHNVALIDGKKHESGAKLVNSELISDDIFVVEAEHTGYFPIKHNRKCVYVKNKGLAIFDSFSGVDSITNVQLLWHLHPDCKLNDNMSRITNNGESIWMKKSCKTEKKVMSGVDGDNPQGWITPGIGIKEPCPTIIESINIEEDSTIITYFEYQKDFFESFPEVEDLVRLQNTQELEPTSPFGFNEHTISKYISNDPMFWQPGTYFGDRNIWKINKSQQKLKPLRLSLDERTIRIKDTLEKRSKLDVPTIYIISNGGSGCHYLGGLISMKAGFQLIDEVYFPPIIIENIESLDGSSSNALIDMVNFVHLGDLKNSETTIPVNTMHLRRDVPLTKIKSSSNSIFIKLIRNPIDVAISRGLRKDEYKTMNKENSGLEINEYLEKQAKRTLNHFKRLSGKMNDVGALYVRFEDLIKDPSNTLKEVFSHIGQELDHKEIEDIMERYQRAKDLTKNKNVSKKPELTNQQKTILVETLGEICEHMGYNVPDYVL